LLHGAKAEVNRKVSREFHSEFSPFCADGCCIEPHKTVDHISNFMVKLMSYSQIGYVEKVGTLTVVLIGEDYIVEQSK